MGKNKLRKWSEMDSWDFVIQPGFNEIFGKDFRLKGKWKSEFFRNGNPLVLELGCGKGEYTTGLAMMYPEKNFVGIDIKGARMWRGARTAHDHSLKNVGFLRTRIEFIRSFFGEGEVDELWITFPDPQMKRRREKKRLTSPIFLNSYRTFLAPGGIVHLKTDSKPLFDYTIKVIEHNSLKINFATDNLYESDYSGEILAIKTHYEKLFLLKGFPITYIQFEVNNEVRFELLEEKNPEQ
ncbi:MAG: tRNA (guanosine(46)-N7)-methyltransferase TrmB [Bacteroidetes bacterium]|nr:tRNA (guanosine(46)-N7)-methyltransferase TrmB [Bacteroidota bacterium]